MNYPLRWLLVATVTLLIIHQALAQKRRYVTKETAHDLTKGFNDLARDLSVQLQTDTSKSEITSPLSIASSLLLLMRTARGESRMDLLRLFGLETKYLVNDPKVPRTFGKLINELLNDHRNVSHIMESTASWKNESKCEVPTDYHYDDEYDDFNPVDINPQDPEQQNQIKLANAIFVQDKFYNNTRLQKLVDQYYRSSVEGLDFFNRPDLATDHINKWTNKHTNGRIKQLISDELSPDTTMVVANALYFKAFWEDVFLAGATKMRKFFPNGENEESVEAEIMAHGGCFPYYRSQQLDARIMGFPYKNRTSTMYVILPNNSSRTKVQQLLHMLDASTLEDLISNMKMTTASVLFPKMHLTSSFDLKTALQKLGMKSLFDRERSNFSLLNPSKPKESPTVSGVLHKVDLAIDESGTEGAAVTATLLDRSMPTVNFRVIVPFILAIRHDATKLLLFYGPVYDPSA
nr:serine protease inhibitor 28Dc-like [Aedes albopictus]XP_029718128.1 serine protease inhibitor 28Dc-like [Aedes albopictus]XP_029718129.1 serine protease inhibitor 28Dc-like [Aedes albopictus]XP_029718130.1 serine protease inhibitor 28Dc-like [Aedes albopictus]XP_029718131.1 serine protease inhibitor 28Dc-like [Aedes albopictus]XP_029718132.1 serine protease inhibitor 28Dc-like [Aedes albopictus]